MGEWGPCVPIFYYFPLWCCKIVVVHSIILVCWVSGECIESVNISERLFDHAQYSLIAKHGAIYYFRPIFCSFTQTIFTYAVVNCRRSSLPVEVTYFVQLDRYGWKWQVWSATARNGMFDTRLKMAISGMHRLEMASLSMQRLKMASLGMHWLEMASLIR